MDNSYSNSNNEGSVNSQESLYKVKNGFDHGSTTNSQPSSQISPNNATSPHNYQPFDHMMHDGYPGGYGDYSHYQPTSPHHQNSMPYQMPLPQQPLMPNKDDGGFYPPNGQTGGYTASNGDPYASVQKPRKRMDVLGTWRCVVGIGLIILESRAH